MRQNRAHGRTGIRGRGVNIKAALVADFPISWAQERLPGLDPEAPRMDV